MIGIPEPAARLYAVALALDMAAKDPDPHRDIEGLSSRRQAPPGPCRRAADWLEAAEACELGKWASFHQPEAA